MTPDPASDPLAAALRRHALATPPAAEVALARARAAWAQPAAPVFGAWRLLAVAAALVVCDLATVAVISAVSERPQALPLERRAAPSVSPVFATAPPCDERLSVSALEPRQLDSNP